MTNFIEKIDLSCPLSLWIRFRLVDNMTTELAQPFKKLKLYPHQLETIKKMESKEANRHKHINVDVNGSSCVVRSNIGILQNKVGSGKTLTCLGLMKRDTVKPMNTTRLFSTIASTEHFGCYLQIRKRENEVEKYSSNLVICSSTLINHWASECERVGVCYEKVVYKRDIKTITERDEDEKEPLVILCTETRYPDLYASMHDKMWKRIFIDEPDSLKTRNMKFLHSEFVWLISATGGKITDTRFRNQHLFNSLGLRDPSVIEALSVRVDETFSVDFKVKRVVHKCASHHVIDAIRGSVDNDIIELMQAGDIVGAIKKLGGESHDGNIVDVLVRNLERERLKASNRKSECKEEKKAAEWERKIQEIDKKIENVKLRFADARNQDCPICMESMQGKCVMVACCQNLICISCLLELEKTTKKCCMCREPIQKDKLMLFSEEKKSKDSHNTPKKSDDEETTEHSSTGLKPRLQTAMELIEKLSKDASKKILVFSAHDTSFREVINSFKTRCLQVKGTAGQRKKAIAAFMTGKSNILLVNSRENGAGLNLQCATDLIKFHPFDKEIDKQVEGRVLRFGLKHAVSIHSFTEEQ